MALRARRAPEVTGLAHMVGAPGLVLEVREGAAWGEVHGERWRVESDGAGPPLLPGQHVRVTGQRGLVLLVQPDAGTPSPVPPPEGEPRHV
jgi:membrane-bound serine protease (ClpP class)